MSRKVKTVSSHREKFPEFRSWDILMIDIVGYSTLYEEDQFREITYLNEVVRNTVTIKKTKTSEKVFLPTGGKMGSDLGC